MIMSKPSLMRIGVSVCLLGERGKLGTQRCHGVSQGDGGGKGTGALRQRGDGAFPPLLPMEEERLRDRELKENFIERVFGDGRRGSPRTGSNPINTHAAGGFRLLPRRRRRFGGASPPSATGSTGGMTLSRA
ncbi:hypothetical protein KI811_07380 [Geobacter hydrogenophilus]|uniref:Uncharacterized protein n=1 Tax=Geobacter hydrogenophilus TaxID=40983 RepID=A0A9W6FZI5_9BACT|nr:hypothetical protein [Geobacter hydrogenophilus]MBT0893629.1 hypothetical protein [Geobacter hydrogenophilus]GLI37674.1 hypothetical protein GHYDROH2_11750 [Geobacter hydrogenophilus]